MSSSKSRTYSSLNLTTIVISSLLVYVIGTPNHRCHDVTSNFHDAGYERVTEQEHLQHEQEQHNNYFFPPRRYSLNSITRIKSLNAVKEVYLAKGVSAPSTDFTNSATHYDGYNINMGQDRGYNKIPRGGNSKAIAIKSSSKDPNKEGLEYVNNMKQTARNLRRKQTMFLIFSRVGFLLALPFTIIGFSLMMVVSLLLTLIRIITFGFGAREVTKIAYCVARVSFSAVIACLVGILNPYFALFGLIAAVGIAGVEMAEPLLKIRYAGEVRKLKHLKKLVSDPVLVETLGMVLKGANTVKEAGRKRVKHSQDTAIQLVETLVDSTAVTQVRQRMERQLPKSVNKWANDQIELIKKSGMLDDAAKKALDALKSQLTIASDLLPYLEALQDVHKRQKPALLK